MDMKVLKKTVEKIVLRETITLTITNNGHTTAAPLASGSGIEIMRKKVGAQDGNLEINHHPLFTLSVVLPGGQNA